MLELFRAETETQTALLTAGLLDLERGEASAQTFEVLMRAAHSLKGAARIMNLSAAVGVAHALEDCFVDANKRQERPGREEIDALFRGVDLLAQLARRTESDISEWGVERAQEIESFIASLTQLRTSAIGATTSRPAEGQRPPVTLAQSQTPTHLGPSATGMRPASRPAPPAMAPPGPSKPSAADSPVRKPQSPERVVRLAAENLNRLLALAGETLVESRWLRPFADSLQRLKRHHMDLGQQVERLRQTLAEQHLDGAGSGLLSDYFRKLAETQQFLSERMQELEMFDRRSAHLAQRLYLEVLRTRMRPFSDGVRRFPRMVRDLARSLGKEIKLEITGETTQVDRDILERLETPLAHLLRNAVDHGCEAPAERLERGKQAECSLRLEARHSAGVLLVTVADDGAGVDFEQVRRAVVRKHLTSSAAAAKLTESELLEFLFLPGFTLRESVTELSGRGFGLDIVQNMVKSVRGSIRLNNQSGKGLRVQLQLPLTLSVVRALLVEVAGEPYAIPLNHITRTLALHREQVRIFGGRPHFDLGGQHIALFTAQEVLDGDGAGPTGAELPVVILSDRNLRFGMIVDRFLGERELVVQPLDPRLGKVKDISAAALMEDGAPVLIIDAEDVIRSAEKLNLEGRTSKLQLAPSPRTPARTKRILAVDDSLTVRELVRKLLLSRGYEAEVAADGMEAWDTVSSKEFDLVITDVDMPRMDGIELAALIKNDPRLKALPVLIVSHKDREEDRLRGLEAGAEYYLTKGSFHEETLVRAVVDLIGEPVS